MNIEESISIPSLKDEYAKLSEVPAQKEPKLSRILRLLGGLVLSSSAATFLVQGWMSWNGTGRLYAFMAFILSLFVCGVFTGLRWKEDKGARVFLGIATAILTASFCQLGAIVTSYLNPVLSYIPRILEYHTASQMDVTTAVVIFLPFAAMVSFTGFSVLSRQKRKILSIGFLLLNIALLVPSRDPMLISLLAFFQAGLIIYLERVEFSKHTYSKSKEALLARSFLLIPLIVLISRNIFLHTSGNILGGCTFAILGAFSLLACSSLSLSEKTSSKLLLASLGMFAASWLMYSDLIIDCFTELRSFRASMNVLPIAMTAIAFSFIKTSRGYALRTIASLAILCTVLAQLGAYHHYFVILSTMLAIVCGAGLVTLGYTVGEKIPFFTGAFLGSAGILKHIVQAIKIYEFSPWISLGVTGAALIILSSYIERNHKMLLDKSRQIYAKIGSWK